MAPRMTSRVAPRSASKGSEAAHLLRKRSVVLNEHKTSVSIEDAFWQSLKEIAEARGVSINTLIGEIDKARQGNLSSAIRLFVLQELRRSR